MAAPLREVLHRLRRLGAAVLNGVVTTILYAGAVLPAGLLVRLLSDPLGRRRPEGTNWHAASPPPPTLDECRRQ